MAGGIIAGVVVAGIGVGLATQSASANSTFGPDDKGKAAAMAKGGQTITGPQLDALLAASQQRPWSEDVAPLDASTQNLRDVVQAAIVDDLTSRQLPATASSRAAWAQDQARAVQRKTLASRAWTKSKAVERRQQVDDYVSFMAAHPEVDSFDDVSVNLKTWNDISVTGDTASVVVTGSSRRHDAASATWIEEGAHQWCLTLSKADGAWAVVDETVLLGADYDR